MATTSLPRCIPMNTTILFRFLLILSLTSAVAADDKPFSDPSAKANRREASAEQQEQRLPIPDKLVVLTFDDSVKSHATVAGPLMKKYGFGATFFITEGFTFTTNKQDYMTWPEIRQLHDDGFEIGNHTKSHMNLTEQNLPRLREELEQIGVRCMEHGIPRPISYAYCGNIVLDDPQVYDILREVGIVWARRGTRPEYNGRDFIGFPFVPGADHPLLIPSTGIPAPGYTLDHFIKSVSKARDWRIAILQFHGVPEGEHPWVHIEKEMFESFMKYLKDNDFNVIALRDLKCYVDPFAIPDDPEAIIGQRRTDLTRSGATSAQPVAGPQSPGAADLDAKTAARLGKKAEALVAAVQQELNRGRTPQKVIDRVQSLDSLIKKRDYQSAESLLDSALRELGVDPKSVIAANGAPQVKKNWALPEFDPVGFTKIFDGETLSDWDGDTTYWSVENGTLVGTVTPETLLKKNSWIVWRGGLVEDFELVLDYRVSARGNSGVGYRLSVLVNDPFSVRGPQADIHGEQLFTGICYEENGRRLLAARGQSTWIDDPGGQPRLIAQIADPTELQGIVRSEDWNRYRLEVKGTDAKHFINGEMMSEVHDHDETNRMHRGLIGVQVHVGPPMKIECRDIYLKHLGPQPKGSADRGGVVYQPLSLLEREHPPTFDNLAKQTARLTAPAAKTPLNDQQKMTIVTRDLRVVRSDLNNTALYGGPKPDLGNERQFDLVVISGAQTIRVPGAGQLMIGKPLDREYRIRMKWNRAKKQYEVRELTAANRDSN